MKRFIQWFIAATVAVSFCAVAADAKAPVAAKANANPKVRLTTTLGVIELELFEDKAPKTVKNFLQYVDSGFYNGTIFHRVIKDFMIQGGGYSGQYIGPRVTLTEKPTRAPIANEANNKLSNATGTIAMARSGDPHSAAAQFFINTVDNTYLDHRNETPQGWGYCVFGKVTKGMEIVRAIESTPTKTISVLENVPAKEIILLSAERIGKTK